ncbi:MAG TPA: cadherin repeat domain-containing protein, partial [Sulfurimonas autotrophica]|nr:cadherin repeat domain-containing protein [Sulfurimonas autotrophica]
MLQGCGGGGGSTTTQATSTTSTIGNDNTAPVFTTADLFSLRENHVVVTTVQAEDTSSVTYTLAGTDAADFLIDSTLGTLKFKTASNFESPTDQNSDNRYEITVIATDTSNNQTQQDINITVSDIDETLTGDSDNDFISDNIETLLQSNINDSDVNNNGVDDGLDTEGIYGDTFFDK